MDCLNQQFAGGEQVTKEKFGRKRPRINVDTIGHVDHGFGRSWSAQRISAYQPHNRTYASVVALA